MTIAHKIKVFLNFYKKRFLHLKPAKRVIAVFVLLGFCFISGLMIGGIRSRMIPSGPVKLEAAGQSEIEFFDYGEEITTGNTASLVTTPFGKLIYSSPETLKISEDLAQLNSGLIYLTTTKKTTLIVKSTYIILSEGFSGVINIENAGLIVFEGEATISEFAPANAGHRISLESPYSVSEFDRKTITSNESWKKLFAVVPDYITLPASLNDLEAPVIKDMTPEDGVSTTNDSAEISGRVTGADKVIFNNEALTLDETLAFKKTVSLTLGKNIFTIRATDNSGNFTLLSITITRTDPCAGNTTCGQCGNAACPVSQPPTSGSCGSGSFNNQLLALINAHRNANGRNSISMTTALNNAAYGHSNYMSSSGSFSHTGSGGSSFTQRCSAAGTSCDAENIAYHSNPSAQNIFDLWRNSSGHNANMLGSHNQVGLCRVGVYVTADFR